MRPFRARRKRRLLLGVAVFLQTSEAFYPTVNNHALLIGSFQRRQVSRPGSIALGMSAINQQDTNFDLDRMERGLTEMQRRDRRDFYTHESWVRHRSPSRFFDNLRGIPVSKAVATIVKEVAVITFISYFLILYNHLLVIGYEDFSFVHHDPILPDFISLPLLSLPREPLVLSSPALALLLVFRTNTCWRRWDEARKACGAIVSHSRTILRKTSSWVMKSESLEEDLPYEEKQRLITRVMAAVWAFARAEKRHLLSEYEDEAQFIADINYNLQEPFASDLIQNKRHRPSFALFELSCALNELPLDMFQRCQLEEATTKLCSSMGACDRLYTSPIPKFYNRHTSRFLSLWLACLPLTLWESIGQVGWNHTYLPFISSTISLGMLGVELISQMLEEPFSLLPLQKIVDGIGKSAQEHLEYNSALVEETNSLEKPTKMRIDERLKKCIGGYDYNSSPEYLEAMSAETIIRHKELGKEASSSLPPPNQSTSGIASMEIPATMEPTKAVTIAPKPASEWDYLAKAAASMKEKETQSWEK